MLLTGTHCTETMRSYVTNPLLHATEGILAALDTSVCVLWEKDCSVVERAEGKRSAYLNLILFVYVMRGVCVCEAGFIWLIQWVTRWSWEGTLLRLSMRSATLPAVRAPIPDHILFLFTFLSLLALCLFSGSPHYTEYVWHSASEVFIAAVLFTLGGGDDIQMARNSIWAFMKVWQWKI